MWVKHTHIVNLILHHHKRAHPHLFTHHCVTTLVSNSKSHTFTRKQCLHGFCFWLDRQCKQPTCDVSTVCFSVERLTRKRAETWWLSYLGTSESPPLNVVGSSSNMEEMSFPSGTDTRVYMTLSWTFLKRARKASCSESSWREKSKGVRLQNQLKNHTHILTFAFVSIHKSQVYEVKR